MKTFLEEFGLVGSAGQSRVTFPCSFDVSTRATQSLLQDGVEDPSVTSAPGTPDLLSAADSGASSSDNITSNAMPDFRITLPAAAIATDTITLYRAGSISIGTGVLDGTDVSNGYVDITVSGLTEASHTITATCTNGVGESVASSGLVVTVDTSAPSAPTAIIVTPVDQGSSEAQTENTQPTFRISLPGNAVTTDVVTLEIDTVDDATASLTGTDISNGYVDIQSAGALADNATYDISAFITDLAGNAGASSSAVEVEVGTAPAAGAIPAVIYDGVGDYLLHTGGPSGAVDGTTGTFVWSGRFNSDGSAMTLFDIPGTVPVLLERQDDNTIDFEVGTAGAVCSASTTAVASSLGFLIVLASFTGTTANLYVIHAAGTIIGAPSAGTGASADLTADWYLGSDGGGASFLDADTAMWWADDGYIDFSDADNREEFWDSTNDLLRDPGSDGSNPSGAQPLVCHQNFSASHVTNTGSGGDADGGSNSGDGTSLGVFAEDFLPGLTANTIRFDGSSAYVERASAGFSGLGNDRVGSIHFCFNRRGGSGEECMVYVGSGTAEVMFVGFDSSNQLVLRLSNGAGSPVTILEIVSTTTYTDSNWHWVTANWNGYATPQNMMYVDGVDETGTPTNGTWADIDFTNKWRFGSTDDSVNRLWFSGSLGQVDFLLDWCDPSDPNTLKYFYDASNARGVGDGADNSDIWGYQPILAWRPSVAAPLANNGSGGDFGVSGGALTDDGDSPVISGVPAYIANAIKFDGGSNLQGWNETPDNQKLFINIWFKRNTVGGLTGLIGSHAGRRFVRLTSSNTFDIRVAGPGAIAIGTATNTETLTDTTSWHNFCLSLNSSTFGAVEHAQAYLDGSPLTMSGGLLSNSAVDMDEQGILGMDGGGFGTNYWDGDIAEYCQAPDAPDLSDSAVMDLIYPAGGKPVFWGLSGLAGPVSPMGVYWRAGISRPNIWRNITPGKTAKWQPGINGTGALAASTTSPTD